MFEFIKKMFSTGLTILSSVNPLSALFKCVSITNQECNARSESANVDSDEPVFYPSSIKTSKPNNINVATISMIHTQNLCS